MCPTKQSNYKKKNYEFRRVANGISANGGGFALLGNQNSVSLAPLPTEIKLLFEKMMQAAALNAQPESAAGFKAVEPITEEEK